MPFRRRESRFFGALDLFRWIPGESRKMGLGRTFLRVAIFVFSFGPRAPIPGCWGVGKVQHMALTVGWRRAIAFWAA